MKLIVNVE